MSHYHAPLASPPVTITATAPIRICDIGGWTDTWVARHGAVFNIAVRPLVEVEIQTFPRGQGQARIVIDAVNYGVRYTPDLDGPDWGAHPLLEAALGTIRPPDDLDITITIGSDAPAGASTGTSAAVVVALLGALDRLAGGTRSAHTIAAEAHAVETVKLGRQCGVQDQLCSAYGGINFIEIVEYPHARVQQLEAPQGVLDELSRRLSLVYLGRPHESSAVHEQVMVTLERLGPDCPQLEALRGAAHKGRDSLMAGGLGALGRAMRENTEAQAWLHADLVHRDTWRLIEIARAHGALGWKVNGAGGDGGSLTILSDDRDAARQRMLQEIRQEHTQAVVIPIALSRDGLSVAERLEC